jgi:Uroporphyrinogen decarboxylase (URO-D)
MTHFTKERFRAICRGERIGDFGILGNGFHMFWQETLPAWVDAGAPSQLADSCSGVSSDISPAVAEFFQFDDSKLLHEIHSGLYASSVMIDFNGVSFEDCSFLVCPPYEPTLLDEDERSLVFLNRAGIKEKLLKKESFNMPMRLEHPVRDRATWEEFRKRLDPSTPDRYPADWDHYVTTVNQLECPVFMEIGGFFGYINEWVGTQNLMYLFYDDPHLVDDMMETILHLEIEMVKRVTKDIKIDLACYWEDMAYKGGSMISPSMVRQYMLPRYSQLNEVVRASGCESFFLDSDGNIDALIPLWLEVGINFFWPLECAAGMDPLALRRKYGKDVILAGGLDKREFLRDKAALRAEVMKKVPALAESGPYFPSLDHLVPIDMPYENFCYYINLLRGIRGDEPISF